MTEHGDQSDIAAAWKTWEAGVPGARKDPEKVWGALNDALHAHATAQKEAAVFAIHVEKLARELIETRSEAARLRGIEARLRESLRVCGGWLERVEWEDYMDGDDPGNDDLNALHTGEPLPDETLRRLGRSAVLREEKP